MKNHLGLVLSLLIPFSGFASEIKENKSSATVSPEASQSTDKADELITNRRFRASNGSLSDFSVNMNLSYSGGSIDKPFAADRPNISNAGDTTSIAGIGGSINTTYRLNKLNRINFGVGVQMLAPFQDSIDTDDPRAKKEFDNNARELDVSNPSLSYTHMNNFFGVQTIASASLTHFTASNLTDIGYDNTVGLTLNTMYNFGGSDFSVGALLVANQYLFDNDDRALQGSQNDLVFGVLPQAEYVINDTLNLRTIIRSHWYQNTQLDESDYRRRPITQSVGLGISVNRDVFLYPNIQFAWADVDTKNTNVGFTANINAF